MQTDSVCKKMNNKIYYIPVHFPLQIHADCHAKFRHDGLKYRIPTDENTGL